MALKFIAHADITDRQAILAQLYYCSPFEPAKTLIDYIDHLCEEEQVSVAELKQAVEKVRVYDTDYPCSKCNVYWRIYEPIFSTPTPMPEERHLCKDCFDFIYRRSTNKIKDE